MANDKVAIWNGGLKFGRAPANGELLIGDGAGLNLSTLSAGSGVSITNSAGGISISATGSGGTVTSVTATSPLASSGGATPDISLGTVGANKGGTGATSLTLNNVILGNGTSAVQFVAPGTSGNVLTSNGTTWASAAAPATWTLLNKSADQSVTSNATTFIDISGLTFSMLANRTYLIRAVMSTQQAAAGGIAFAALGPASATAIRVAGFISGGNAAIINITDTPSYSTALVSTVGISTLGMATFNAIIQNGANAGTFLFQFRQSSSNATATTIEKGSYLEYTVI